MRRSTPAAKHAVEGITKSVALETATSGIRVNAVAPGPTDTGMLTRFTGTDENKAILAKQVPLGRLGFPEEVADGIVFLGQTKQGSSPVTFSLSMAVTAPTDPTSQGDCHVQPVRPHTPDRADTVRRG